MNKLTLKYELDLDFVLIALTAPLKDYQLSFKINKQLHVQFYRIDELCIPMDKQGTISCFSMYHYETASSHANFYLLANKGTQGYLIPEMKTADYFIIIKDFIDQEDLQQFISGLNQIPEVQVAAEVEPKKLKSKENLIF